MRQIVLVIDDEASVRSLLRQALERDGYEVLEAGNGALGLDLLREREVDLVITDIFMPEKEGLETIGSARRLRPELPILAISGGGRRGELAYLSMARTLGARGTLVKPFDLTELLSTVRALLDGPGPPQAEAGRG